MARRIKESEDGIKAVAFKSRAEAEAYLSQVSTSVKEVDFKREADDFHITYAGGTIGHCRMHRGSHSAIAYDVVESDEIHFLLPLKSGLRFEGRAVDVSAAAQLTGLVLPPMSQGRMSSSGDVSGISLFASANAVAEHAAKLGNPAKLQKLDFGGPRSVDLGDPLNDALGRNMTYVFREMMILGQKGLGSVAGAHFDELLLGLLAQVAPGAASAAVLSDHPQPSIALGVVRRAQEQIREFASEPIRLADLANGLGVGMRALQVAFRRHVGCSPREYLLRCRLDVARERLLSAPEDVKVAAIALDCGFTDLAHFSKKYRETFGELPSATRRRRRG
jgi:AraC-like DNA-binding protein